MDANANLIQAIAYLLAAVLVPISVAVLLLLARKSMRRMLLTLIICGIVLSGIEFLVTLTVDGLYRAMVGSAQYDVVLGVRYVVNGVRVYVGFGAVVFALYDSISNNRKAWFLALLSFLIVGFAATTVFDYSYLYIPRSIITFVVGYLGLASVLAYGLFGMHSSRREQPGTALLPVANAPDSSPADN